MTKEPHHQHEFWQRHELGPPTFSKLFCFQEECSEGLDPELYPPELVGPKLGIRADDDHLKALRSILDQKKP